jgi:chemotaxis response regulator CheB
MLVLADNDVGGAVAVLRRVLESAENAVAYEILEVTFTDFESLGLPRDAADRTVWQACQAADAVLITGNRSGGPDSLDQVIRELSDEASLPVLTIADQRRVTRDAVYANACVMRLLDFLDRLDSLRGTGRLFIP